LALSENDDADDDEMAIGIRGFYSPKARDVPDSNLYNPAGTGKHRISKYPARTGTGYL